MLRLVPFVLPPGVDSFAVAAAFGAALIIRKLAG
jgi:hypothetical protein